MRSFEWSATNWSIDLAKLAKRASADRAKAMIDGRPPYRQT